MSQVEVRANLADEVLALAFGVLIILITFGDNRVYPWVGNLDQVLGPCAGRLMDVLYPLASITIFLLHGKVRGSLRIHASTILVFLVFCASLAMVTIDDVLAGLGHSVTLPDNFWGIAQWFYPFVSGSSFLAFGWICARLKGRTNES